MFIYWIKFNLLLSDSLYLSRMVLSSGGIICHRPFVGLLENRLTRRIRHQEASSVGTLCLPHRKHFSNGNILLAPLMGPWLSIFVEMPPRNPFDVSEDRVIVPYLKDLQVEIQEQIAKREQELKLKYRQCFTKKVWWKGLPRNENIPIIVDPAAILQISQPIIPRLCEIGLGEQSLNDTCPRLRAQVLAEVHHVFRGAAPMAPSITFAWSRTSSTSIDDTMTSQPGQWCSIRRWYNDIKWN